MSVAHKHTCVGCPRLVHSKNKEVIELIKREYLKDDTPWFIGFSGGKDSSAVLTLAFQAMKEIRGHHKPIYVLYCDTGVDIPLIASMVRETLEELKREAKDHGLPFVIRYAVPSLKDRFFVKVIGRGYPTPTNIFRWCTDKLRINPIKNVTDRIIENHENGVILLGVREDESIERAKSMNKYRVSKSYYRQSGNGKIKIFCPIREFTLKDVWGTVLSDFAPKSLNGERLSSLYKDASGECPTVKDPHGPPCGKGRFGCWVCTVVRKDRAITNLINEGYEGLDGLLDFRNWIYEFRENMRYRHRNRRNGVKGKGPFSINGRMIILEKLLELESSSCHKLISKAELHEIFKTWDDDNLVSSRKIKLLLDSGKFPKLKRLHEIFTLGLKKSLY